MAESILQTRQLTKQYGHALALDHVDMHLEKGQIYGPVSYTHLTLPTNSLV